MEYHKKANKSFALATWQRIAANVQPELLAIAAIPDHKLFIDYLNQYHSDWSEKEQMNAWVAALTLCREEKKKDSPLKSSQVKVCVHHSLSAISSFVAVCYESSLSNIFWI
eukprot:323368_1